MPPFATPRRTNTRYRHFVAQGRHFEGAGGTVGDPRSSVAGPVPHSAPHTTQTYHHRRGSLTTETDDRPDRHRRHAASSVVGAIDNIRAGHRREPTAQTALMAGSCTINLVGIRACGIRRSTSPCVARHATLGGIGRGRRSGCTKASGQRPAHHRCSVPGATIVVRASTVNGMLAANRTNTSIRLATGQRAGKVAAVSGRPALTTGGNQP